jgi:SAM-dependent methyltransferase
MSGADGRAPLAADPRLVEMRAAWENKPALRAVYAGYYERLARALRPGPTLEVGGGFGNLKSFAPAVISIDILPAPWLDLMADAHDLPFANSSFENLVMFDVLHHIERPLAFLAEAARVLRPGGRLAMMEPAITPLSWVFYSCFHPEPVVMSEDPLAEKARRPARDPFEANQAIPSLLFGRHRARLERAVPDLRISTIERMSFLAYPLSGGYRAWTLLPASLVRPLTRIEDWVAPALGRLAAFRLFAVLERR